MVKVYEALFLVTSVVSVENRWPCFHHTSTVEHISLVIARFLSLIFENIHVYLLKVESLEITTVQPKGAIYLRIPRSLLSWHI